TMNTTRAPFDRVDFRQALGSAVDLTQVVTSVLDGVGIPASPGFVHPDSPFAEKGLTHQFSVDKANAALDKLGYSAKAADGVRMARAGKRLDFELLADAARPV